MPAQPSAEWRRTWRCLPYTPPHPHPHERDRAVISRSGLVDGVAVLHPVALETTSASVRPRPHAVDGTPPHPRLAAPARCPSSRLTCSANDRVLGLVCRANGRSTPAHPCSHPVASATRRPPPATCDAAAAKSNARARASRLLPCVPTAASKPHTCLVNLKARNALHRVDRADKHEAEVAIGAMGRSKCAFDVRKNGRKRTDFAPKLDLNMGVTVKLGGQVRTTIWRIRSD